jgi:hypothetical protein
MAFLFHVSVATTAIFLLLKLFGLISITFLWAFSPLWIYVIYLIDHVIHLCIAHMTMGFDFPNKRDVDDSARSGSFYDK